MGLGNGELAKLGLLLETNVDVLEELRPTDVQGLLGVTAGSYGAMTMGMCFVFVGRPGPVFEKE